jgi:hypothetical protein
MDSRPYRRPDPPSLRLTRMGSCRPAAHFDRNESQAIWGTDTNYGFLVLFFQLSYSLLELVHTRHGEF